MTALVSPEELPTAGRTASWSPRNKARRLSASAEEDGEDVAWRDGCKGRGLSTLAKEDGEDVTWRDGCKGRGLSTLAKEDGEDVTWRGGGRYLSPLALGSFSATVMSIGRRSTGCGAG